MTLLPSLDDPQPLITKSEFVARYLREAVLSGEMAPGTKVRQQEVADALKVSPTPVREAIRQLEAEGYFESSPHVSTRVRVLDRQSMDEVYRLRASLEGMLASDAVRHITPAVLEKLRQFNAEFSDANARGDSAQARRVNYRFHSLVWQTARQPVTASLVESLWAKFPQVLSHVPDRGQRSIREHDRLLDALEAQDAEAAEVAARTHIASGRQEMKQAIENNEAMLEGSTIGSGARR